MSLEAWGDEDWNAAGNYYAEQLLEAGWLTDEDAEELHTEIKHLKKQLLYCKLGFAAILWLVLIALCLQV